ncbi:MAG: hypothetical protein LUC88_04530 [Prevotella sp.]|nr:hypothetical protein [Prevotella sp.]
MKRQKLVTKIERCHITQIGTVTRKGMVSVDIIAGADWSEIEIKVPASLTITDKIEDNVPIFTATLTFETCEELEDRERYAWRLTLIDGTQMLIGTDERPYPVMTVSESHPDSVTDDQLNKVTVTYSSQFTIPVISAD